MASDVRRAALLELVSNSATIRAARYRETAAHLRDMAGAEILTRVRARLLDLAGHYEGLASAADPGRADDR